MFEHFHADDRVVPFVFASAVERCDEIEAKAGAPAETSAAVVDLRFVDLDTDRFGRRGCPGQQERQERAVSAAVVKNPLAFEPRGELQSGFEAAAMTPRDQVVLAENLLRRVMTVLECRIDRGRQYFRS